MSKKLISFLNDLLKRAMCESRLNGVNKIEYVCVFVRDKRLSNFFFYQSVCSDKK